MNLYKEERVLVIMESVSQLQTELKEAVEKRKHLLQELRQINFCIDVFQKEVSFRSN